jgi:hypothetical protein
MTSLRRALFVSFLALCVIAAAKEPPVVNRYSCSTRMTVDGWEGTESLPVSTKAVNQGECAIGGIADEVGQADPELSTVDSILVLECFDRCADKIGEFPEAWQGRTGWLQRRTKKKRDLYYTVQNEGDDVFLRAETVGRATNAGCKADIRLQDFNVLRWRWRVHSLPEGANEEEKGRNDSAAAVRLVFKRRWFVPKTLKYVWSTSLPVGLETESPLSSKTKVIVLESGTEKRGEWVWEEVNAYEDYVRVFGGEPKLVKALAVLTDGDNTGSAVKADYDDFAFMKVRSDSSTAVASALGGRKNEGP